MAEMLGRLTADTGRWVLKQGLRATAPDFWTFQDRTTYRVPARPAISSTPPVRGYGSLRNFPFWDIVLWFLSLLFLIFTARQERRLKHRASLASQTPLHTLRDLRLALRAPPNGFQDDTEDEALSPCSPCSGLSDVSSPRNDVEGELEGPNPSRRRPCRPKPTKKPRHTPDSPETEVPPIEAPFPVGPVQVTIYSMAGNIVCGPMKLTGDFTVADLMRKVANTINEHPLSINLLSGPELLDPKRTLNEVGLLGPVELSLVVSRTRESIAEALYGRASGELWAPPNGLVQAPFSGRSVIFFEAVVIRLYDQWVTIRYRRQVKAGRPAGRDDPGSDSEYEDVEESRWEPREEVIERRRTMVRTFFLIDDSGERAVLDLEDVEGWAFQNSRLTFSETEEAPGNLNVGGALLALVDTERETGTRREEKTLRCGERCEILGEVNLMPTGLRFCNPRLPSEQLHRIDSDNLLEDRPSKLRDKTCLAKVLRDQDVCLEQVELRRSKKYRVGKWFLIAIWLFFGLRLWRQLGLTELLKRLFMLNKAMVTSAPTCAAPLKV